MSDAQIQAIKDVIKMTSINEDRVLTCRNVSKYFYLQKLSNVIL